MSLVAVMYRHRVLEGTDEKKDTERERERLETERKIAIRLISLEKRHIVPIYIYIYAAWDSAFAGG